MKSKITLSRKEYNYIGYSQNLKDILDNKGMNSQRTCTKGKDCTYNTLFHYPAGHCYPF